MLRRVLTLACLFVVPAAGMAVPTPVEQAIDALRAAAMGPVALRVSPVTGAVTFFAPRGVSPLRVAARTAASPEARARAFLGEHGKAFGLAATPELRTERTVHDRLGMDHVRFQQLYQGVPVTGGELLVHLRGDAVVAANGRTAPGLSGIDPRPVLTAAEARARAAALLAKHRGIDDATFTPARLEVLDRGLLESRATPVRLAWHLQASRPGLLEDFWVDARTGTVLLHFSQLESARNRTIYTAGDTTTLPGNLLRTEGGPGTGDTDADDAYEFAGITYDYYLNQHGRDSYDGAGAELRSTVHACQASACPLQNAFWNGSQMVYGDDFAAADDVVAHELTHAVTGSTAGLFYYMQSGAMNESFSDIFGETVDLDDAVGNDSAAVRWDIAEDLPIGAIRNMMNPPSHNGDPADTSQYECFSDASDSGGVHENSGIPNHAYALMVDGGSYGGHSITPIGLDQAAAIEYRALTQYLLSASGFQDDADALYQACKDLVGTGGITGGDCDQVTNATAAVGMDQPVSCTPSATAVPALCPAGQAVHDWAYVDFESPIGIPDCPADLASQPAWCVESPAGSQGAYATSGTQSLWGYDKPTPEVQGGYVDFNTGDPLPPNARVQFNHSFGFEDDGFGDYFDGGLLWYSIDNGGSWHDASSLISAGASYTGTLYDGSGNSYGGSAAFVGESWGYTATQLDLSSLAGHPFRLAWVVTTDDGTDDYGWFIDDARVYQCTVANALFSDGFESGNMGAWSAIRP